MSSDNTVWNFYMTSIIDRNYIFMPVCSKYIMMLLILSWLFRSVKWCQCIIIISNKTSTWLSSFGANDSCLKTCLKPGWHKGLNSVFCLWSCFNRTLVRKFIMMTEIQEITFHFQVFAWRQYTNQIVFWSEYSQQTQSSDSKKQIMPEIKWRWEEEKFCHTMLQLISILIRCKNPSGMNIIFFVWLMLLIGY